MNLTRRNFMQAVSAISLVGIPALPKYVKPINFKAFCGYGWKYQLRDPFVQAGHKYATNAYCMIRQKTDLPDTELGQSDCQPKRLPENCNQFLVHDCEGDPVKITLPVDHCRDQVCGSCEGIRTFNVRCRYCNDTGKEFQRVTYFGREFGGAIVKIIAEELPNPMALGVNGDMMHFAFDGGEGVLMALLPLREGGEA